MRSLISVCSEYCQLYMAKPICECKKLLLALMAALVFQTIVTLWNIVKYNCHLREGPVLILKGNSLK